MLFKIAGFFFGWGFAAIGISAIIFVIACARFIVDEVAK